MYQFNNYRLGVGRHLPSFVALRSVLLFGIALFGLLTSSLAQPVCYDYNTSGSRVVRKNCSPNVACNCPTGTVTKYYVGEDDETTFLSATEMYLFNTGSISGGCITVAGKLVIDADYVFSNVTMMMQPGAEIVVNNPDFELGLFGSTLKACEKLWRGINVGQSCTFKSFNSTIQDAYHAVELANSSMGTISGTTFNKNYIGINVDGSNNNSTISTSVVIKGNTFKCDGGLLLKWDNSFVSYLSRAGIEGDKAVFTVGIEGEPSSVNDFQQMFCGVLAYQSIANIYYANIHDMGGGNYNVSPSLSRIAPQSLGLGAWESNIKIENTYIGKVDRAIHLDKSIKFILKTSKIEYCLGGVLLNEQTSGEIRIENNIDISANLVAIRLKNVLFTSVSITGNLIHAYLKNPYFIDNNIQGYAIELDNEAPDDPNPNPNAPVVTKTISSNRIYHHTGFHGISILINKKYLIQYNEVYVVKGDLNSNTSAHGIILSGGIYESTNNNKIIGNSSGGFFTDPMPSTYNAFAFYGNNAPNNEYCCNISSNTKTGFSFSGNNPNTLLRSNEMRSHSDNGLHIQAASLIGQQINNWNKWTGSYGTKAAKNDNTTNLLASKFEVSQPIGNQWYPSNIVPTTGWFFNPNVSVKQDCPTSETGTCSAVFSAFSNSNSTTLATAYATNQYGNTTYGAYTTWSGQRWVLKQIETNPDWLSNTTINTFNVNNQNSNIKKINDLDVQLAQLKQPTTVQQTSLNTIYATMEANDKRLAQLSKLLAGKPSEADSLEYWTERSELLTDQAGMMGRMGKIQQEIRTARGAKLDQALALNASITAQNEFERNEKTINAIYLNTVAREDSMSVADKASVTRIASLCPMVGGTAVFKARFLYGYYAVPSFDDTKLCGGASTPPPAGKVASNNTTSDVLMYPNPSSDEVYFSTSSTEPVQLILIDITGRVVAEQAFTSTTQISTRNLPNGQYFCQIWKGNQKVDTQKLSVIH